jgi:hypothetical protein
MQGLIILYSSDITPIPFLHLITPYGLPPGGEIEVASYNIKKSGGRDDVQKSGGDEMYTGKGQDASWGGGFLYLLSPDADDLALLIDTYLVETGVIVEHEGSEVLLCRVIVNGRP